MRQVNLVLAFVLLGNVLCTVTQIGLTFANWSMRSSQPLCHSGVQGGAMKAPHQHPGPGLTDVTSASTTCPPCPRAPTCPDQGNDKAVAAVAALVRSVTPNPMVTTANPRGHQTSTLAEVDIHQGGGNKGQKVNRRSAVTIPNVLGELNSENGKLMISSTVDRLCLDIGAHWSAPSPREWWKDHAETHVVAVEANPWSAMWLKYFATRHYYNNVYGHMADETHKNRTAAGELQCSTRIVQRCLDHGWSHWMNNEEKHTIIGAAMVGPTKNPGAGKSEGDVTQGKLGYFHTGLTNRSDVGSIFELEKQYLKERRISTKNVNRPAVVPLLTLGELLDFLPTQSQPSSKDIAPSPLQWDTLKIDAQGADAIILFGAATSKSNPTHNLIRNFMCVIGEFLDDEYDTKNSHFAGREKAFDIEHKSYKNRVPPTMVEPHVKFLVHTHGFIKIGHEDKDRGFFINPRFEEVFRRGPEHYSCRAVDERRKHKRIIQALDRHLEALEKKNSVNKTSENTVKTQ